MKHRQRSHMILVSLSVFIFMTLICSYIENDSVFHVTVGEKNADPKIETVVNAVATASTETSSDAISSNASKTKKKNEIKEVYGLNKTANGRLYFLKKNGKRYQGYKKIDGAEYYFAGKNSYAVVNKWKYVKLNGTSYKLYFGKNGKRKKDVTNILPSNTRYYLDVLLAKNMVMVYAKDGNKGYTIPAKAMICSTGMPGHGTIIGTYSLYKIAPWRSLFYNSVGQYATNIHGNILFHSVVYKRYGDHYSLDKTEYNKLGKSASHGCVRLPVKDAKWIYDHTGNIDKAVLRTATVSEKTPLDKPKKKKIGKTKDGRYYDPTDPKCK
ncbi:MAG: L,D-transpeptidase [Lachnospiraceae bacterium]|nr:L,D-transpeptidase [Lachnospiraceae bacterium]